MTTVERHTVNAAFAAENSPRLAVSFERNTPKVAQRASQLTSLLDIAILRLGSQCAIDPAGSQNDTWISLVQASQTASAIFDAATTDMDHADCLIGQEFIQVPATGPTYYSDPARWQTALWLAMISRDHNRIRNLCSVSEHTLRTNSDEFDDYIYSWILTLQKYLLNDRDEVQEKMKETAQLLAPDSTSRSNPEYLDKIVRPQLLMFLELGSRDEAGFNNALRECLDAHREFWTVNSERSSSPRGYVALAPLAFTCVAHDSGMSVEVESDYVPRDLIRGSRVGELQF
ncbi:immunity 49 family protein [Saccharopolyspora shandongensis]|uniref:immunity 49 family protein n=1 Tax=Saccharopolyspora shandongensis TaxID=418495 RepID=UPI0033CFDAFD